MAPRPLPFDITGDPTPEKMEQLQRMLEMLFQDLGDVSDTAESVGGGSSEVADGAITNAKLADMEAARIKGRASGAGTGIPTDLTGTQATVILDVMVGDAGAGGTKGLAPAPGAGDAAAGRFLKASGAWAVPDQLSGDAAAWDTVKKKTVNDDVTNNGTLTSDSELVIALAANTLYLIEFAVLYQSNNASSAYLWRVAHPGTTRGEQALGHYNYLTTGGSSAMTPNVGSTSAWPTGSGIQAGILAVDTPTPMNGRFVVYTSAAGNLTWQQANTAPAAGRTTRTCIGSTLRMKKLTP